MPLSIRKYASALTNLTQLCLHFPIFKAEKRDCVILLLQNLFAAFTCIRSNVVRTYSRLIMILAVVTYPTTLLETRVITSKTLQFNKPSAHPMDVGMTTMAHNIHA